MNKKFFTLMAAALVTGSVAAQNYDAGTDFEYRLGAGDYTKIVTGGSTNPAFNGANLVTGATFSKDVKKINSNYWYQLEVSGNTGFNTGAAFVLIQERNRETGKIYLRIVEKLGTSSAPLTASLWKIKYSEEDGVSGGKFTFVNKETGYELSYDQILAVTGNVEELGKGVADWNWYINNDNGDDAMDFSTLYSVYANKEGKKKVMYLKTATATDASEAINTALVTEGYNCQIDGNAAPATSLVAVTIADATASAPTDGLKIKPVVAAPFFMTKEDFNNRLDSDGKGNFKFTVEEENVVGADALEQEFVAVDGLVSTPETAFGSDDYKYFNLSFKAGANYLQISTERYEENKLPSVSPSVKVIAAAAPTGGNYLKARAMFRATYFPTEDRVFIEPLNAGIMTDEEYNKKTAFADCVAAKEFTQKGVVSALNAGGTQLTSANSVKNAGVDDYTEKSVSFTTVKLSDGSKVITVAPASKDGFAVTTSIEQSFSYLKRVAFDSDLKTIKVGDEYIVCNFNGKMQLDVPTDNQDYNNMPATMWTIEKKGNEQVIVKNREFGKTVFEGQLYVDTDGKYFAINKTEAGDLTDGLFAGAKLNNRVAYTIDPVTATNALTKADHGYYDAGDNLLVKKFTFELNDNLVDGHFLNLTNDKFFVPTKGEKSHYEFVEAADGAVTFGSQVAELPALSRKAYNVKVLDETLVDNDKTWIYQVIENGKPTYYKAMTEAEADAATPKLKKARFFFKSDEVMGENKTETYVLIKADNDNKSESQASLESTSKLAYDDLNNIPSEPSTTFAIKLADVQLYRDLTAEKTVKFFLKRGAANEYLYEGNGTETFGFLGLTSEGVHQAEGYNPSMASFKVSDNGGIMPEFLFAVDTATVKDGFYCPIHGYELTDPCGHAEEYKGYMTGRFLVNMKNSTKDYKFESYDRLGFIEGILRDGKLYILSEYDPLNEKTALTLDELKVAEEKGGVIDPVYFDTEDDMSLTPAVMGSPYTFSLRLIDREDEENFFIESERTAVGSFNGGWIKVQNGCPVIARHNTVGTSEDHDDHTGSIDEIMRDAQIFSLSEGDDVPTSNEAIDAESTVKVVAVNGGIQVLNAAGKTVTVTNVLGQTVASTVVSSDNATIATPAGVVVVAVEGEAAVKAIVK
ncbi:DUF6383 domain-containing protein [Parabacteroides sp. AF18-52]|jgi:hypothetical protein|uniref:DUF6383 domain-containing protein n=1 Tax=Parabacteroides TaxID=375288 RepID=UPI0011C3FF45|nr:DUF6383 domain-containing protein [Parabacteroides sp. AF18-52]